MWGNEDVGNCWYSPFENILQSCPMITMPNKWPQHAIKKLKLQFEMWNSWQLHPFIFQLQKGHRIMSQILLYMENDAVVFVQKELQRLQDRPPQGSLPFRWSWVSFSKAKVCKNHWSRSDPFERPFDSLRSPITWIVSPIPRALPFKIRIEEKRPTDLDAFALQTDYGSVWKSVERLLLDKINGFWLWLPITVSTATAASYLDVSTLLAHAEHAAAQQYPASSQQQRITSLHSSFLRNGSCSSCASHAFYGSVAKGTGIPDGGSGWKVCIVNEFKGSIRSSMASKSNISLPSTICGIESPFTDFLPLVFRYTRFRWVKLVTSTKIWAFSFRNPGAGTTTHLLNM